MKNLAIKELLILAKKVPDSGILIQTLRNLPNVSFEMVEVCGGNVRHIAD